MTKLAFDTVNVDGRRRTITTTPYQHTLEREAAETVSAREFYNIKYRELSSKRASGASNLKNGMVEYAHRYGTQEQADIIEGMDANRLQWMYENRIIDTTEYFVYDDSNVSAAGGTIRHGHVKESTIQTYIENYELLEQRGRAEIRESRR